MRIEQILATYYADAFKLGQFGMAYDENNEAYIQFWNVPNVAQPSIDDINALDTPELQKQFAMNQFFLSFVAMLMPFIDLVAQQKAYDNAVSCVSYINSSNSEWQAEANAFMLWRDSVWVYILQQKADIIAGLRSIPESSESLLNELPVIVWPV